MPSPFIESIRSNMRLLGYSLRTEKPHPYWIQRFICISITGITLSN